MITCVIRYEIDPYKVEEFYARRWGEAIPQCGAELFGYFAPHEGSATMARRENAEPRTNSHLHNGRGNGELHPRGR